MSNDKNLVRGLVVGIGAGLVASFVMNRFQDLWGRFDDSVQGGQPATLKAANKLSEAVAETPVPKGDENTASKAVHYTTGALIGAFYGAASEFAPAVKAAVGATYSGFIWAALDNGLVPALGLGPKPKDIPMKGHIYALSSHVVFGFSLEITRRVLTSLL